MVPAMPIRMSPSVASSGKARRTGQGSDGSAAVMESRSRVTQPEYKPAGQQGGRGPGGQHAEARPGADGQAVQIGGGLDGESGGHRPDLLQVSVPVCITHHVSDDGEKV